MADLHLEPRHLAIVQEILRRHIPDRSVWAFGSRASGRLLRKYSDLDLAVEGELEWGTAGCLRDDFDECLLPIKVDIVELGSVDPSFRTRIEKDFVVVQEPLAPGLSPARIEVGAGL
jgi:predicted nucleotidyltransferase